MLSLPRLPVASKSFAAPDRKDHCRKRRATGIVIRQGRKSRTLKARAAVILSAGAFGSPQILQLSGIGPAEHLRSMGIDVVLDKPAVGEDLQDHIDYVSSFESPSTDFFGDSLAGTWRMAKALFEHRMKRTGILTTCFAEAGGFWKLTLHSLHPISSIISFRRCSKTMGGRK